MVTLSSVSYGSGITDCTNPFPYVRVPTTSPRSRSWTAPVTISEAEAVRSSTSTASRVEGGTSGAPRDAYVTRVSDVRPCVLTIGLPCGSSCSATASAAFSSPPVLPRRSSTRASIELPECAACACSCSSAARISAGAMAEKEASLMNPADAPSPIGASAANGTEGSSTRCRRRVAARVAPNGSCASGASPSRASATCTAVPGSPRSAAITSSSRLPATGSPLIPRMWSPTRTPSSYA